MKCTGLGPVFSTAVTNTRSPRRLRYTFPASRITPFPRLTCRASPDRAHARSFQMDRLGFRAWAARLERFPLGHPVVCGATSALSGAGNRKPRNSNLTRPSLVRIPRAVQLHDEVNPSSELPRVKITSKVLLYITTCAIKIFNFSLNYSIFYSISEEFVLNASDNFGNPQQYHHRRRAMPALREGQARGSRLQTYLEE